MAAAAPTATDLENAIDGLSIIPAAERDDLFALWGLDSRAAAALKAWENETGWQPFQSTGADSTRYFDPPGLFGHSPQHGGGRILDLQSGLLSVTTVITGYSISTPGTALTLGEDYFLLPQNAPARGKPYTDVEFMATLYGQPQSLKITGEWGYCGQGSDTFPDDAWQAIVDGALLGLYTHMAAALSKGVESVSDAGSTVRYRTLKEERDEWKQARDGALWDYRRVTL